MKLAVTLRAHGHEVQEIYGDTWAPFMDKGQATHIMFPFLLAAYARRRRFEVIDVHSADGALVCSATKVARSHGLEHAHYRVLRESADLSPRFRLYMRLFRLPASARAFRTAAAIISPSRSDAADFQSHGISHGAEIKVIPHGLGSEWLHIKRAPGRSSTLRVLYIGDWSQTKGADLIPELLTALTTHVGRFKFTAISPNWPGNALSGVGVEFDQVAAVQTGAEVREIMLSHDVLLVPSRYESFGRVIVEGMACGMVVVASNYGAAADLIESGKNGLIANFGAPLSVAPEIAVALDSAAEIGEAAQASVAGLSWKCVAERTVDVYTQAIDVSRMGAGILTGPR